MEHDDIASNERLLTDNKQLIAHLCNLIDHMNGQIAALSAYVAHMNRSNTVSEEEIIAIGKELIGPTIQRDFCVGSPSHSAEEQVVKISRISSKLDHNESE